MTEATIAAPRNRGSIFDLLAALLCFGFIVFILGSLVFGPRTHAAPPTISSDATLPAGTPATSSHP
ncbi:MAG TPA: hypothetical protein VEA77_00720 [Hyphomicrobium sp.]|nr:hypothetical protein [Hyphomicrobium sp.]